jgi:deoxyadenosine/deoxycytidine kinase
MIIISLEGNVCAGKSTLLSKLKDLEVLPSFLKSEKTESSRFMESARVNRDSCRKLFAEE